ncbi:MAG: KilA-N domain-containing protein [Prolixibacteraceae bacterium]|nr:KilA-N domain-containing protein [Prolixibacteraceae bacterium]
MVNATQIANIINKEVTFFLRNEDTKRFINSCLKTENSQFLDIEKKEGMAYRKPLELRLNFNKQ